jgi:integrase/recombinase XerD
MPRHRRRLPVILTPFESESLASSARSSAEGARTRIKRRDAQRDLVMLITGSLTGMRVSELCKIRIEDLDLAGQVSSVKHGKGDKDRNIPIADKLLPLLKSWIGDRQQGFVFEGRPGRPLSRRTFHERLAALAKRAGIIKKVYPHLLRHTFATMLLDTGTHLHEVQQLLGHANIQTTAIYLHVNVRRLKGGIDRL